MSRIYPNKGTQTYWDDVQVSISNIRVPASSAPSWTTYNMGIGGGVAFPVLGFGVGEYAYFDIQTPHGMQINSPISVHVHYTTPTDGSGDSFRFQLDVVSANGDGTWAAPSGSPYDTEIGMGADYSNSHVITNVGTIEDGYDISSVHKCKLTRIAVSGGAIEYGSDVYLYYIDAHVKKDTPGSRYLFTK